MTSEYFLTFGKYYRTELGQLTQRSPEHILPSTRLTFIIDMSILFPVTETLRYDCAPSKTGASILDHFSIHGSLGELIAARKLSIL